MEQHDVRDVEALRKRPDLLAWADVYVAISNNTNVDVVAAAGVPLVFVDVLFWMKRQRTHAMDVASVYVIENYPGVDARLADLPVDGAIRVGPILARSKRASDGRAPVHVSIGGAASPDLVPGRNTQYPTRVVALADRLAQREGWPFLEVAMGSAARASVVPRSRAGAVTLDGATYRRRLTQADALLTSPGLNGPLEAFVAEVPVVFLPPQNLTQVFHLRAYEEAGLTPAGLGLADLLPGFHVDARAPEAVGTALVLDALARLSDRHWESVLEHVMARLAAVRTEPFEQTRRQRAWVDSLGIDGASEVADQIRRLAS
ncbi:MAG: hypothetical protein H6726_22950 [Sandaracinaceae bacterium]|nr:hypothetical protein [Sandaracinaceae bacterium]